MTGPVHRLPAALADRYRIERELGAGGRAALIQIWHSSVGDAELGILDL